MAIKLVYNPFTNNFDYASESGGGGGGGPGGVTSWVDVTTNTQAMAINTGYTANAMSLVTLTLPAICIYGTVFRVAGKGVGGWKIALNAGQVIHFGNVDTTIGTAGFLSSTNQYDAIELLCSVANTEFTVIGGPQGDLTVN